MTLGALLMTLRSLLMTSGALVMTLGALWAAGLPIIGQLNQGD